MVLVSETGLLQFAGLVRRERFGRAVAQDEVVVGFNHVTDGVQHLQTVETLVIVVIVEPWGRSIPANQLIRDRQLI